MSKSTELAYITVYDADLNPHKFGPISVEVEHDPKCEGWDAIAHDEREARENIIADIEVDITGPIVDGCKIGDAPRVIQ